MMFTVRLDIYIGFVRISQPERYLVIRAPSSQSVDHGFDSLVELDQKT